MLGEKKRAMEWIGRWWNGWRAVDWKLKNLRWKLEITEANLAQDGWTESKRRAMRAIRDK